MTSDSPLRKGDAFKFLVTLGGMGLRFRGTVVHTTPVADGRVVAGISFDKSSNLSLSLLDNYLKSHFNSFPITGEREGFSDMFQKWLKNPRVCRDISKSSTIT